MRDCVNVEMREALPDFVNGGLGEACRAEVKAHLAGCADCRAELSIIESARRLFARASPLDVTRIVHRLPAPRTAPSWGAQRWRLAAAIAFAVVAGATVVLRDGMNSPRGSDIVRSEARTALPPSGVVASQPAHTSRERAIRTGPEAVALSLGGDLSDLSDDQVHQLLGLVDALEPLPSADLELETPAWRNVLPYEEGV